MQNPITSGILALALSSFVSVAAIGQQPGGAPGLPPRPPVPKSVGETVPETLITVEFEGGKVKDYIEAVKVASKKAGLEVNVICPVNARDLELPSTSLKSVTVLTAMNAIGSALAGTSEYAFEAYKVGRAENESPTFTLQFYPSRL
ncbi:MAG: hypothetical protein H7210_11190, partial [Pyrinomonadaceae bacterium]|nr:hypothetical protein [Phycisphaerales bacterium]